MIHLTKFDGGELHLNPDMILSVEATPDTHILLTNGNRLLVREPPAVIVDRVVTLKARIVARAFGQAEPEGA